MIRKESGKMTVGMLLYDGVQATDFTAPYDVFVMARPAGAPNPVEAPPLFRVFTIGQQRLVTCEGGLRMLTDYRLTDHPPIDVLVIPGGFGVFQVRTDTEITDWIRRTAADAHLVTSVCLGAMLLAEVGLLDGLPATTHWAFLDELRRLAPAAEILAGVRFTDAGTVITSAGISAGIDMALHTLERLQGSDVAGQTARILEYDHWKPSRKPVAVR